MTALLIALPAVRMRNSSQRPRTTRVRNSRRSAVLGRALWDELSGMAMFRSAKERWGNNLMSF